MDDLPLFEQLADGSLQRVPTREAAARREGRTVRMAISRERGRRLILLTAEEEAAHAAAAAAAEKQAAEEAAAAASLSRAKAEAKAGAEAKLAKLGLTPEEIEALKG